MNDNSEVLRAIGRVEGQMGTLVTLCDRLSTRQDSADARHHTLESKVTTIETTARTDKRWVAGIAVALSSAAGIVVAYLKG